MFATWLTMIVSYGPVGLARPVVWVVRLPPLLIRIEPEPAPVVQDPAADPVALDEHPGGFAVAPSDPATCP